MSTNASQSPAKYSGEKRCPLPDCPSEPHATARDLTALISPSSISQTRSVSYFDNVEARTQSPLFELDDLKSLPTWPLSSSDNDDSNFATIHKGIVFCPSRTVLDLSLPTFILCHAYSANDVFAPATNPPICLLTLRSPLLLSVIPIQQTIVPYVTVNNVLRGLYSALREPLSPEYQKLVPQSLRPGVTQACIKRRGTSLLHVDLLLGATKFIGLRRLVENGCWEIMVR